MGTKSNRVLIISGSDISTTVRLKNPNTGDPVDLNSISKIQFTFKNRDRSNLIIDDIQIPAVKATITYETVTFTAGIAGADGNDIILVFDGINDIDTVVDAWNTANPSNTVVHDGTGTDVLAAGTTRLTNGYDAYYPVEIVGDPLLGKVKITLLEKETTLLRRGSNQSFSVSIDYGTFPGGTRIKGLFSRLDVIEDE